MPGANELTLLPELLQSQNIVPEKHCFCFHINGLMQERHNSIANALELCLSCTNPSICQRMIWALLTLLDIILKQLMPTHDPVIHDFVC